MTAAVVVGVPTYNGADTVEEALLSLLNQKGPEFLLVVVDDASCDGTSDIVAALATADPRIRLVKNRKRLGMVANWNRVLAESLRQAPEARYFAWGSDHDVWRPGWLQALTAALDADPSAVLAYSLVARVNPDESVGGDWRFDTGGVASPLDRLGRTVRNGVAGDMIYGLFRADVPRDVGGYQRVIFPDRLLLARAALRGTFVQVPEVLWTRRMGALSTPERQRHTLFSGSAPWYLRLPWWVQHPWVLDEGTAASLTYARAAGGVALRVPRAAAGRLMRAAGLGRSR